MKRLAIAGAIAFFVIVTYRFQYPSATVRYRLTLEAEVDGKHEIGSGVIEVSYSKNSHFFGSMSEFASGVRGEAVVLDLGSRGTLFALLRGGEDSGSSAEGIVLRAFNFPGGALPSPVEKGIADVQRLSGKAELSIRSLPMLVRFRDPNDQMSVEKVDPLNLERAFGPNVKLVRATLEIVPSGVWPLSLMGVTGQPISTGIISRLPWLAALNGRYLGGASTARNAPLDGLDSGDFKRD